MHKHTIDWYLQLQLKSDAAQAQKRWSTAEKGAATANRTRVIDLLRLFLFVPSSNGFTGAFTNELVTLDAEFPISENTQELRLMAGLIMVAAFEKPSGLANAFSLGLRAANFPGGRVKPVQPAMMTEAELYLRREAARVRPNDFEAAMKLSTANVLKQLVKTLTEAEAGTDEPKKAVASKAFRDAIPIALNTTAEMLARLITQVAEESAVLWWVLGEFSESLRKPVNALEQDAYALPAAAEAALRTLQVPPPPNMGALLARVLRACRPTEKKLSLGDYVKAADEQWRTEQTKLGSVADCPDLCPVSGLVEKTQELGVTAAIKALPKLCPGLKADITMTPSQAAEQYYNELVFRRALDAVTPT